MEEDSCGRRQCSYTGEDGMKVDAQDQKATTFVQTRTTTGGHMRCREQDPSLQTTHQMTDGLANYAMNHGKSSMLAMTTEGAEHIIWKGVHPNLEGDTSRWNEERGAEACIRC